MSWTKLNDDQKRKYLAENKIPLVSVNVKEEYMTMYFSKRGKISKEDATILLQSSSDRDLMLLYYYLGACPLSCLKNLLAKNMSVKERVACVRRLLRTFENVVDKKACFLAILNVKNRELFQELMSRVTIPYPLLNKITLDCVKNNYPLHSIRYLSDQGADPSYVSSFVTITDEVDYALCPQMDTSPD